MAVRPLPAALVAGVALSACPVDLPAQQRCNWTQWGQGPQHQGQACVPGQPPDRVLARIAYDPLSSLESAEVPEGEAPELTIHYASPLTVDDEVYLVVKGGTYVPCEPPGSGSLADGGPCGPDARAGLTWSVKAYRWEGGALTERWTYPTDWRPLPVSFTGWEAPLQPAVAGDWVWVPGAGGTLDQVRRSDGTRQRRVDPYAALDGGLAATLFAVTGVAASPRGELYYGVLEYPPPSPLSDFVPADALVRVTLDGGVTLAATATLVPEGWDSEGCRGTFGARNPRPWPAVNDAGAWLTAPFVPCGSQRPAVSSVPAIAPDGTVYLVTRDTYNSRYSYLVATSPALEPRWAASMRGHLADGCGVTVPILPGPPQGQADLSSCRAGATVGVDPATNLPPAGRAIDSSSASPVVLPDGTILYGAYTGYNGARGHLLRFSPDAGAFLGSYDFGWDLTPAVWTHDGTFSVLMKDNHYVGTPTASPTYFLTRLDRQLEPEWWFRNTNSFSCGEDGGCVGDHPFGFEWCISAPAVDSLGNVYGNSEDGNLYVVGADGGEQARRFLKLAIGAAYTPLALDSQGRIYAMNGGDLFVLGR